MKTEVKKLPKSQLEISFEIPAETFAIYLDKALEHFKHHTKIDGFRKGTVPKEMVEKKVGDENLLMEAGEMAVKELYARYVNEHNLEPIGQPDVSIKKIAKGSEFLFTVTIAVLPEISLPDYKALLAKIETKDVTVTPEEIEEAVRYVQKSRAIFAPLDRGAEKKDFVEIEYTNEHIQAGKPVRDRFILGEAGFMQDFEDNLLGMKTNEEKKFTATFPDTTPNKALAGKKSEFSVKMISVQSMTLPVLDDAFAKSLGMFDTLVALQDNIKAGITAEKQESEKHRRRGEILDSIATKTTFELPEKMVAFEEARLLEDLKNQIAQNPQVNFDDYLKSIKKTEEELKASFRNEAERRIKNFLVLREIGRQEKVIVSNEELEEQLNRDLKQYSPEQINKIDIGQLKEYTKGGIFNEKVFQVLETFLSNVKK